MRCGRGKEGLFIMEVRVVGVQRGSPDVNKRTRGEAWKERRRSEAWCGVKLDSPRLLRLAIEPLDVRLFAAGSNNSRRAALLMIVSHSVGRGAHRSVSICLWCGAQEVGGGRRFPRRRWLLGRVAGAFTLARAALSIVAVRRGGQHQNALSIMLCNTIAKPQHNRGGQQQCAQQ